jgi:arginyl-tRNA synthetase
MRSHEQHLDFDLDLAKSRSNENPVYYIQYAYARICSVLRNARQLDLPHNEAIGEAALECLVEDHELSLMRTLSRYPEVIDSAARNRTPHVLAHFMHTVATEFHAYYNAHQFLVEDENVRNARLNLVLAARYVLQNGLGILSISTPEEM